MSESFHHKVETLVDNDLFQYFQETALHVGRPAVVLHDVTSKFIIIFSHVTPIMLYFYFGTSLRNINVDFFCFVVTDVKV